MRAHFKCQVFWGAKLDSIGDDLTVLAGSAGLTITRFEFIKEQWLIIAALVLIFIIQLTMALSKYQKMTSFHTYLAKAAAVVSAFFLLSTFFFDEIFYWLFYMAIGITALELIEEIILVVIIPEWRANVKGIYWVLKEKRT